MFFVFFVRFTLELLLTCLILLFYKSNLLQLTYQQLFHFTHVLLLLKQQDRPWFLITKQRIHSFVILYHSIHVRSQLIAHDKSAAASSASSKAPFFQNCFAVRELFIRTYHFPSIW